MKCNKCNKEVFLLLKHNNKDLCPSCALSEGMTQEEINNILSEAEQ